MAKNTNGVILALLAGIITGVGIGILLAPDKGENTRKKLKNTLGKSKADWLEEYDRLLASLKDKTADSVSGFQEALESLIAKEEQNTEQLIAALEQKLAQLKNS